MARDHESGIRIAFKILRFWALGVGLIAAIFFVVRGEVADAVLSTAAGLLAFSILATYEAFKLGKVSFLRFIALSQGLIILLVVVAIFLGRVAD